MAARHRQHLTQYLDSHRNKRSETKQKEETSKRGGKQTKPTRSANEDKGSLTQSDSRRQLGSQKQSDGQTQSTDSRSNNSTVRSGVSDNVPVMFTSSSRSRASFLAARRKPPTKFEGPASINHLPDELLFGIFGYLDAGDLLMSARVCKRWQTLASDNFLWSSIFEKYGSAGGSQHSSGAERRALSHYKTLCIKQCSEKRNKKAIRLLKKVSPFTGLARDTDKALKAAGVYYQLCLIDHDKQEHNLTSRDVFYHPMSTCVRWFDLEMTHIKKVREVRIYSVNPLFFKQNGSAISNSPYQRSLLLSIPMDWNKVLHTSQPSGGDDMVKLYTLTHGILVATWKGDGELAFICASLHNNELVNKCLRGTSTQLYDLGTHKVIPDDIDSAYGLHDYRCTVEIRTLRNSIWSQQFNSLSCKKENIGTGYATFPLIRKDHPVDHVILQKKLNFPWKTDAFKGIVENMVWVDVTVLDERNEPFWCISSSAKVNGEMLQENLNFDYTNQEVFTMSYMDERGKFVAHMSQTDEKDYFMTRLDLKLSLDAINDWFGTKYK